MSSSYGRLAAIRDYWMPRNLNARVEVRVTDIDEILRELVRVTTLAAERAAPTPPAQDDEALELLRELVEARDDFTDSGDPQTMRAAGQRIRAAESAARALLTKRGAV